MSQKEKKKKGLKKLALAAGLCMAVAAPIALTGCSEKQVDVGTFWLSGIDAPAASNGKTGDFYLDTLTLDIYQKDSSGWKKVGSLKSEKGVGISSIEKTGSVGLNDTYTITFTDGTTSQYVVTNGSDGIAGSDGITPHIGPNGNWWIGNDDLGVKAQGPEGEKGDTGATGPEGEKGDTGETGPEGEKGDTGETGPEGEQGVPGVGILKVESEYGFAENGQQCVYFTIYYTDGTNEKIISILPRKIETIEVKNTNIFVLEEDANDDVETGIVLKIRYENSNDVDIVPVTKGMISGIDDFSKPGNYLVEISYQDQLIETDVNIDLNIEEMTLLGSFAAGQSLQMTEGFTSIDVYAEGWAVANFNPMMRMVDNKTYFKWEAISDSETPEKTTIVAQLEYSELVLDLSIDSTNTENNVIDMYQSTNAPIATYVGSYFSMECTVKVYDEGFEYPIFNVEAEVQPGQTIIVSSSKFEPIIKGDKKYIIYEGMFAYLDDQEGTFELAETSASVEGEYFEDFADAVEYAIANDKVLKLEQDLEINNEIIVAGDLTIDLNCRTINSTHSGSLFVLTSGNLVVNNGWLVTKGETFFVDTNMDEDINAVTELYLGENLIIRSENNCVYIRGEGASLVTYADMETTSTGTDVAAIQGNGNLENRIEKIHIAGGRVVNNGGFEAVYAPQTGALIVDEGAYIEGAVAIYLKSGNITINGGHFVAYGAKQEYQYFANGSILTGDALVIDACGYPGGNPTVTIIDGNFTSENGYGIGYYTHENNKAIIKNYSNTELNYREENPAPSFGVEIMHNDVSATVEVGSYIDGTYEFNGQIEFSVSDDSYSHNIPLNAFEINIQNREHILRYSFRNNAEMAFEVLKNRDFDVNNMTIKYALSNEAVEDLSSLSFVDEFETFEVDAFEEIYLYVKISVDNINNAAGVDGMQGFILQPVQEVNVLLNQEFGTAVGLSISEIQEKVYNKIQNSSAGQKEFYTVETLESEKGIRLENYYTKFATISNIKNFNGIKVEGVDFIDNGSGFELIQISVGNNIHINTLPVIFDEITGDVYIASIILATEMMTAEKITLVYNNGTKIYDVALPNQENQLLTINPIVNNNTIVEEDGKYIIVGNSKNTKLLFDFEGNTNTSNKVLCVTKKLNYINNGEFERVGYGFTLTDASVGDGKYSVGIYPAYGKDFTDPETVEEYEGRQLVYTAYIHEFGVVHATIEFDPNGTV